MDKIKYTLEKIGSNNNINLVMELGREKIDILKLLRPSIEFKNEKDCYGVKIFYIEKAKSLLLEDLNNINMAHPKNLFNFIQYCITNYPAHKYILILGGHGYEYVGTMIDYSCDYPYIMGIPEMVKAINAVNSKRKQIKIDLLIMDSCYLNNIETLYELGKEKEHMIQNMLTYINEGPLAGLSYNKLIETIINNYRISTEILIRKIIDSQNFNLIAFNINNPILKKIKRAINDFSYFYLSCREKEIASLPDLFNSYNTDSSCGTFIKKYYKYLDKITICYKSYNTVEQPLIRLFKQSLVNKNKLILYSKFGFSQNNYWVNLLSIKNINKNLPPMIKINYEPIKLTFSAVVNCTKMANYNLNEESIFNIVEKLYNLKGWKKEN